ncbi:ABC transporter substrate-binding protein [Cohnella sp. GCM10012308]|uniref:ABC transporter substrate-binding protein n=1 Tax=Cohnella sp. GCM10012308 TaxID=3317329 RepID=UPI003615D945
MSRKRWIPATMTAVLAAGLLAGCGKSNEGANGADAGQSGGEAKDVTLRFSWWGGDDRHKATLAAIEAYKKVAPNVTIEAEYQGFDGYEQKVKTQLASATAADIIQLDVPWMTELSKSGFFLDLSKEPNMSLDSFDADFLKNFGTYDGKVVGLPTGVNAYGLVINKTAADKLGVPTDIKWDWDSLYEAGKKLHDSDKTKYLLVADHGMVMQDFTNILKQRTGNQWVNNDYTLGFAKEDAVAGFDWIKRATEAGVYQPLGEADLFFGKTEQNTKWINGDIPMIPAMSSTMLTLKSVLPAGTVVTTALPPVTKDGKDTAELVRPSQLVAVNAKSKNTDEAVKFLNWFLTNPDAAVLLGDVRSSPASKSAQEAALAAGKIDPAVTKAVADGLASAGIVDGVVATNSEVSAVLQDVIEQAAYGKLTPDKAADTLIQTLQKKLEELKGRG